MSLSKNLLHEIADRLHEAEASRHPVEGLVKTYPEMGEEDAYAIQMINCARALKDDKRIVGYKIGLTSREAQRQFQIARPDFGHLFDTMAVLEDEEIDLTRLIQPRIEGEVAFVLGRELRGPGLTIVDVLNAVEYATVALEICDSRIKDWKITAADTIADNGSSALFVLSGRKQRIEGLDLPSLGMALSKNGEVWVTGAGRAVMGNPLSAVVFLANELGLHERSLLPGEVILSGALSAMLTVGPRDAYTCEMKDLGKVSVRFGDRGTK